MAQSKRGAQNRGRGNDDRPGSQRAGSARAGSARALKVRAAAVEDVLAATYPQAECTLDAQGPFQLLLATVLSAQTTDARVNQVTPELFARYPQPVDLAQAHQNDVEEILRPLGFFRTKAAHMIGIAAALTDPVTGAALPVPQTAAGLQALPGVGPKTANVVLGNAFGIPAITVDTHVGRLSRRLGLTKNTDPVHVEQDLARVLTPVDWTVTCHRLIAHGRSICLARRPRCDQCPLAELCPQQGV